MQDSVHWTEYLMGFAVHASSKSKDTTKVGAVLTRGRVVLCTGFNGAPPGVKDAPDRYSREEGRKYRFITHAEAATLMTAAREGVHVGGCDLYVTHFPCSACARLIIAAGLNKLVVGPGTTSMPAAEFEAARTMFEEAGVQYVEVKK